MDPYQHYAYLAVTCHFIHASSSLHSVFPAAHAAENLAKTKSALVSEGGITHTFNCLVTDVRGTNCVAQTLN